MSKVWDKESVVMLIYLCVAGLVTLISLALTGTLMVLGIMWLWRQL